MSFASLTRRRDRFRFRSVACVVLVLGGLSGRSAFAQLGEAFNPNPPLTPQPANPFDSQTPGGSPTPAPGFGVPTPAPESPDGGGTSSILKGGSLDGSPSGAAPAEETAEQAARRKEAEEISALLKDEKYDEAEKRLKADLEKSPNDSGAWFFLAGAYRLQNKYDDAIDAYTRCAELMPEYGDTYLRRGISWFHKGEYGIAVFDFEKAATLNYFDPRPEFWKGLALAALDQHRLAISSYSTALKYEPRFVPGFVNRGLSYMIMEDYLAAVINFNEAIRLEPRNAGHYFLRGIAFVKNRQDDRAMDSYNAAIRIDPKFAEAYLNRSIVEGRLGKTAEATRDRAEALRLKPELAAIDINAKPVALPQSSAAFNGPLP